MKTPRLLALVSPHITDPGFKALLAGAMADADALIEKMNTNEKEHRSEMGGRFGAAHFFSGRGEGR